MKIKQKKTFFKYIGPNTAILQKKLAAEFSYFFYQKNIFDKKNILDFVWKPN
jgi:hypothetical protein